MQSLYSVLSDALDVVERKTQRPVETFVRAYALQGDETAQTLVKQWDIEDGAVPVAYYRLDGTDVESLDEVAAGMGVSRKEAAFYVVETKDLPQSVRQEAVLELKEDADDHSEDAMVALIPDNPRLVAVADGVPVERLHCTLGYWSDIRELGMTADAFLAWVQGLGIPAILGAQINGVTTFYSDGDTKPLVLNVDSPDIDKARRIVVDGANESHIPLNSEHGFTPHMTVAYVEQPDDVETPKLPITMSFSTVWVSYGDRNWTIDLRSGGGTAKLEVETKKDRIRYVRTPAGMRRYRRPVGAPITPWEDLPASIRERFARIYGRPGGSATNEPDWETAILDDQDLARSPRGRAILQARINRPDRERERRESVANTGRRTRRTIRQIPPEETVRPATPHEAGFVKDFVDSILDPSPESARDAANWFREHNDRMHRLARMDIQEVLDGREGDLGDGERRRLEDWHAILRGRLLPPTTTPTVQVADEDSSVVRIGNLNWPSQISAREYNELDDGPRDYYESDGQGNYNVRSEYIEGRTSPRRKKQPTLPGMENYADKIDKTSKSKRGRIAKKVTEFAKTGGKRDPLSGGEPVSIPFGSSGHLRTLQMIAQRGTTDQGFPLYAGTDGREYAVVPYGGMFMVTAKSRTENIYTPERNGFASEAEALSWLNMHMQTQPRVGGSPYDHFSYQAKDIEDREIREYLLSLGNRTYANGFSTVASTFEVTRNRIYAGGVVYLHGVRVGHFDRQIDFNQGVLYNSLLELDSNAQGQGFAEELYRTWERYAEEMGVAEVNVHANIDIGGYAWAKRGFELRYPGTESLLEIVNDALYRKSIGHLDPAAKGEYAALLTAIEEGAVTSVGEIANYGNYRWVQQKEVARIREDGSYETAIITFPMTIGKWVLLGSDWEGVKKVGVGYEKKSDIPDYLRRIELFVAEHGHEWLPGGYDKPAAESDFNLMWADLMMDDADIETKKLRYVRTPAGARRFKRPIGSPIVKTPVSNALSGLKRVTVSIWPEGGEREQIDAIDFGFIRDKYLPRVFGREATKDHYPEKAVWNPVLHGGVEKRTVGFNEGPPVFAVMEPDPDLVRMFGPDALRKYNGKTEPIKHVYRAMDAVEWGEAQKRGYIASDERQNIFPGWEGTNAGVNVQTALSYLPRDGESVIVKIDVAEEDGWFTSDADNYIRTRARVPVDRVSAVTGVLSSREGHVTNITDTALNTEEDKRVPTLDDFLRAKPFKEYGRSSLSNPDTPRTRPVTSEEFQRLSLEGGRRLRQLRGAHGSTTALTSWAVQNAAWESLQTEWGGQTINARTGIPYEGNTGFALTAKTAGTKTVTIPIDSDRITFDEAYERARRKFNNLLMYENHYLGIFRDEDLGEIHFDPVIVVDSVDDVEKIGAYTHALGGAFSFATGDGYWPPYVGDE